LTGGQKEKAQGYDLSVYRKINGELNFHFRAASRSKEMTFDVPLAGMRERLRQVGAQLEIERRERGITVRAIAPLPRDAS
jgi:signal transduction histidine kinase